MIGAMALILVALGALAFWATFSMQEHARALSRAGVQTSGHLRAVQALGQIDTHTDLLEDGINKRVLLDLRSAEQVLLDSLDRMQLSDVAVEERALATWAKPEIERRLLPSVETFVDAVRAGDEDAVAVAEERTEDIVEGLQLRLNDIAYDPSQLLKEEAAAASVAENKLHRAAFVLVPLGLASVTLCAWQLVLYRGRWQATARAALEKSDLDARTDELTGLANRRALLEELERRTRTGQEYVLVFADLNGFKAYNDSFGHAAGDALLRRLAMKLQLASNGHGLPVRLGGDEFCVLFDAATPVDDVGGLVEDALAEQGEGFRISSACGVVRVPEEAADGAQALRLADLRMYASKTAGRTTAERQMCQLLVRMLDARHPGLGDRIETMTELAGACAESLELAPDEVHDVRLAAQLHDIGKVAIPDSIISKPGPLTADEWDFSRTHTLVGERILSAAPATEKVASLVRASHERWDGGGYPDGLAGDRIPVAARIVAVADAFSEMTEDRPCQEARSFLDALDELHRCAGTQFDPAVVKAFTAAFTATVRQRSAAAAA